MSLATFKDLCADAADPLRVAGFWGPLLGLTVEAMDDGDAVLRTADGAAVLWVNRVPEPKVAKNRVHPDIWIETDDLLLELGATLQHDHGPYRVFQDPEGNEFCSFRPERELRAPAEVFALCTDSAAPVASAAWWAGVIGGEIGPGPDGTPRYLHGAAGFGPVVWKFVPVDDLRVAKNRWHWDVLADVVDLVAAGAEVVREPDGVIDWTVLVDPDGNEFCAFAPRAGGAGGPGTGQPHPSVFGRS